MPRDRMFDWRQNGFSQSVAARILAAKLTLPKNNHFNKVCKLAATWNWVLQALGECWYWWKTHGLWHGCQKYFVQGRAIEDFSKIFLRRKVVMFVFFPLETEKTNFVYQNFWNPALFPTCKTHGKILEVSRFVMVLRNRVGQKKNFFLIFKERGS